jgi:hypothetical protein
MSQKVVNGFLQSHNYTWLKSKFIGTLATQNSQIKTDIDLVNDTIGEAMTLVAADTNLLRVVRDGAVLIESQGYELTAPNQIRITPGILQSEVIEFSLFTGVSGVIETIPSLPPAPGGSGYDQQTYEALVWSDGSQIEVNAFAATVVVGKTRITTHFDIDEGRVDVFINGTRVGIHSGVWSVVDQDTIELDDDYSSTNMKIEIVKNIVG